MSTKRTLSHNIKTKDASCPSYHLYEECFEDDGSLYLELEGADVRFVAKNDRVVVRIPCEVWNRIIQIGKRKPEQD